MVVITIFLTSCNNGSLDQKLAMQMLQTQVPEEQLMEKASTYDEYELLYGYSYLSWEEENWNNGFSRGTKRRNFRVLGAAKEYLIVRNDRGSKPELIFRVGKRKVGEITSISQEKGSNTAFVDYVLEDSINEFGKQVYDLMDKRYEKRATFALNEGEWKLEKVQ